MKRIYGKGCLHMLPLPGGFAFAVQEQTEEGAPVVAYRIYSIDKSMVSPITRSLYLMAKFGPDPDVYTPKVKDFLNCMAVSLPSGCMLTAYPGGKAIILETDGRAVWSGEFTRKGKGPADIAVMGSSIWASFPESDCLLRYSLRGMKESLRIGGGEISTFCEPFGLFKRDDENMLVCNRRDFKVKIVNVNSYAVSDYLEFEEPVMQYIKISSQEFVLLRSGIYKL